MNFNDKSQMSLFILLGIILLLLSALYISSKNDFDSIDLSYEKNIKKTLPAKSVDFYIESCIEQEVDNALTYALMQNSYYKMGTANDVPEIPILMYIDFYDRDTRVGEFSLRTIDNAVLLYLYDTLPSCVASIYDTYSDYNVSADNEIFDLKVRRVNQSLVVELKHPIKVSTQNEVLIFEDYIVKIDKIPFSLIEQDVNKILNSIFDDVINFNPQEETNISFDLTQSNLENIVGRDDLNLILIKEPEQGMIRDYIIILNYRKPWKDSSIFFKIRDETLEGVER